MNSSRKGRNCSFVLLMAVLLTSPRRKNATNSVPSSNVNSSIGSRARPGLKGAGTRATRIGFAMSRRSGVYRMWPNSSSGELPMKLPEFIRKGGVPMGPIEDFPLGSLQRAKAHSVGLVSTWNHTEVAHKCWDGEIQRAKKEK